MARWCERQGVPPGGLLPLAQGWRLARGWYADRLDPGLRRKPTDQAQALFAAVGLTGPFWQLDA